jgi:hypothetical protein
VYGEMSPSRTCRNVRVMTIPHATLVHGQSSVQPRAASDETSAGKTS